MVKVNKHKRTRKNGASVVKQHSRKKSLKDPKGGLSKAGREHYGVKKGVTNYEGASLADKKRWISWASRFYKNPTGPMSKPNGEPTRLALTANAWGETVPKTTAQAKKIYAKAQKRKQTLINKGLM